MADQLSQKADIALNDLASGGLLTVGQSNKFIEQLIDTPTILNEARVVPMDRPSIELNKTKFGSRVLRCAEDGSGNRAIWSGSRALDSANRSQPDLGRITLNTKEYIAEVRLPYEVLEDQIERGGFEDTVMRMLSKRVALDIEELLIQGDAGNVSDAYLGSQDGILEYVASNQVDAAGANISASVFNNAFKAMPTQYRGDLAALRFYAAHNIVADYRLALATRQTGLGDEFLTGRSPVYVMGVQMKPVAKMPNSDIVLIDPKNVLVGFQRNIRIETDKDIQTREVIIVVTFRLALQIEEELAAVRIKNLAVV